MLPRPGPLGPRRRPLVLFSAPKDPGRLEMYFDDIEHKVGYMWFFDDHVIEGAPTYPSETGRL